MYSLLGILYSPPIQIVVSLLISIASLIILLGCQFGITFAIMIYSISYFTRFIDICIALFSRIYKFCNPEEFERVLKNLQKTFILHGNSETKGLYVWHPHGLFASAPFIHCAMNKGTGSKKMPIVTLSMMFKIPFIRDLLRMHGFINSNYSTIKNYLNSDTSVSLVVGGVEEMFYTEKKKLNLILKNRKGYLKLALETKKPLIPIITYGENELYETVPELTNTSWNRAWKEIVGFMFPFITWKSILRWSNLIYEPFEPIHSHIGEPVYPEDDDTIETLREKYITALKDLFEKTRPDGYEIVLL